MRLVARDAKVSWEYPFGGDASPRLLSRI